MFHRAYGADAAGEMLRSRRATEFDPALVDLFRRRAAEMLDGLDEVDAWDTVIGGGEDLGPELSEAALTGVLRVFADYADLKSPNAVLAAAGHRIRRRPALPCGLTPREAEILVLVANGLSSKEMAERLSVSVHTVRSHVEHVYAKIGVSSRGAAAMFAMRHGLVGSRIGT